MVKRRIKSFVGLCLLILMSAGLTISTLHSHHHLDLNHPPDLADTGSCITSDTTLCPISGIFKIATPPVSYSGETFFYVDQIIIEDNHCVANLSFAVNKGRSPPLVA